MKNILLLQPFGSAPNIRQLFHRSKSCLDIVGYCTAEYRADLLSQTSSVSLLYCTQTFTTRNSPQRQYNWIANKKKFNKGFETSQKYC